jgi:hypothetical protein
LTLDVNVVRKLAWIAVFGVAFAYVESSIVVYLRALYYPEGFAFPLKLISHEHLVVELARELATIVVLGTAAIIAGIKGWQRFGYFLVVFGVWDIFYYVWLKVILNWPLTIVDWDILFLIPLPWIGPVLAPLLIAALMTSFGAIIVIRIGNGDYFQPNVLSWFAAIIATVILLYSFVLDIPATLLGKMPAPYHYEFLVVGLFLYLAGFFVASKRPPVDSKTTA